MWGWFGGAAAQKRKDAPKSAILDLRSQLDMLTKREKFLMTQIEEQEALARKNVTTNKTAAKAALRRKKNHESSLEQTITQIGTLEQQINSIESANINRETLAAMEKANGAMKEIYKNLTPEKVDKTMYVDVFGCYGSVVFSLILIVVLVYREDLREHNDLSQEIVAAMATGVGETVDEGELDEELELLQQEQLDEQMLKTGNVPVLDAVHKLPTPATTELVSSRKQPVEDDAEAELEKLRAEMAM
ncbi:unnamed protein product [Clonostachys rosea]|uniref:Vacuolar-sorting protein SNF7 n=1 Tax=Bionectria ochroleuca TaxID=29856 RepID=A0ABY6UD48_BIOOC|nr:unnamed protein product [Clonostachys rosea]